MTNRIEQINARIEELTEAMVELKSSYIANFDFCLDEVTFERIDNETGETLKEYRVSSLDSDEPDIEWNTDNDGGFGVWNRLNKEVKAIVLELYALNKELDEIEEAELLEVSDEAEWKEHFNSLKSEETEETAETEESTLIRKNVVKVNDQWTQTTEITRNSQKPNCFTRHTFWTFGLNTNRTNEVSIELDNSFLEEELKKIESNIRHYGNRVLENI